MHFFQYSTIIAVCLFIMAGCTPKSSETTAGVPTDSSSPVAAEPHSHRSEGPHHGTLVELGNEEYHAEVVHDDQSVTIYMLDSSATSPASIDAMELTINLMHDGTPEQFKLAASPETGDANGKSSRFRLADAGLAEHIDDEAALPKLMVTINGTPYHGEIKHDHDHSDHGHSH